MELPQGHDRKMEVNDKASERSSSSISSPPTSPQQVNSADTIRVSRPSYSSPGRSGGGVVANPASTTPRVSNAATNSNIPTTATTTTNGTAPQKPKRQRKKKEIGPDGKPVVDEKPKEKKPRKPREKKDASASGEKAAAPRKKQKSEEKPPAPAPALTPHDTVTSSSRQPTIIETFSAFTQPNQPASITATAPPQPRTSENMTQSSVSRPSNPPTPRPFSSGQNYDPIRGSTMESAPRLSNPSTSTPAAQTSPHVNRASASPAIASLIDPPTAIKTSAPLPASYSPQTTVQQPSFVPSQHSPPPPKPTSNFVPPPTQPQPQPQLQPSSPFSKGQPRIPQADGTVDAMDVEPTCENQQVPEIKAPKSSSSAPTPKARPTPPKGTGSGLLSTADLFGERSSEPSERKGVNIDIQIPLNPAGGNTINIAQEIIRKYGRDAINPRAAAHREQLLRIAAEQNRFHDSNDDMSVDLLSEMEGDSNVEMGGMDDEKSNTGLDNDGKPARKRRKKVEEYDKEDDFIDDTELAWQEQAAVAKDGFFVYSGPLVPEGQQAQVESSSSTRGSRGGRSRGRGSRSTTSGTTHASLAEKSRDSSTSTRARTRGTRGTSAPRKPRITKADRERMEAEKMDRERAAAGMGGPNGAPIALAPTPTPGPQGPTTQPQPQPQQSYAQPVGSAV